MLKIKAKIEEKRTCIISCKCLLIWYCGI